MQGATFLIIYEQSSIQIYRSIIRQQINKIYPNISITKQIVIRLCKITLFLYTKQNNFTCNLQYKYWTYNINMFCINCLIQFILHLNYKLYYLLQFKQYNLSKRFLNWCQQNPSLKQSLQTTIYNNFFQITFNYMHSYPVKASYMIVSEFLQPDWKLNKSKKNKSLSNENYFLTQIRDLLQLSKFTQFLILLKQILKQISKFRSQIQKIVIKPPLQDYHRIVYKHIIFTIKFCSQKITKN
eukprot:TRINITY_DN11917_c0_g2_i6.p1 TRINITY_DN11917_c0_g2~~TRINITY_DN11917_c0_g2_i6.p1  ORF type:complete len:240 (+),score=-23.19 TRINITY_DN11917_c0_g2_i6:236-955(+)